MLTDKNPGQLSSLCVTHIFRDLFFYFLESDHLDERPIPEVFEREKVLRSEYRDLGTARGAGSRRESCGDLPTLRFERCGRSQDQLLLGLPEQGEVGGGGLAHIAAELLVVLVGRRVQLGQPLLELELLGCDLGPHVLELGADIEGRSWHGSFSSRGRGGPDFRGALLLLVRAVLVRREQRDRGGGPRQRLPVPFVMLRKRGTPRGPQGGEVEGAGGSEQRQEEGAHRHLLCSRRPAFFY
mmetsp:Transcript_8781/g.36320  ORF Transcript_8781/g.36320 Transcript_8781/m.36320 type:complete len:240 (+) Transcript_8781:1070-1789(+)